MPFAYQGTATPLHSALSWAPGIAYSTGEYTFPATSSGQGQYFVAVQGGTSGATEPPWATPGSLPIPGTLFVDGGVIWSCVGSYQQDDIPPILTLPSDTDPPNAASVNRPLQTLADFVALVSTQKLDSSFTKALADTSGSNGTGLGGYGTVSTSLVKLSQIPNAVIIQNFTITLPYAANLAATTQYSSGTIYVPKRFPTQMLSLSVTQDGPSNPSSTDGVSGFSATIQSLTSGGGSGSFNIIMETFAAGPVTAGNWTLYATALGY